MNKPNVRDLGRKYAVLAAVVAVAFWLASRRMALTGGIVMAIGPSTDGRALACRCRLDRTPGVSRVPTACRVVAAAAATDWLPLRLPPDGKQPDRSGLADQAAQRS